MPFGPRLVLTVVDDGEGFESTAEPTAGHFGLKLIRDTVAEAGGTLLVNSLIGRGTRVELSLPRD
jgi:two-component system NarL family sensor kinase